MTAGAGILHIEKPPEWLVVSGGLFHGLQLWVNLPAAQKLTAPRYQDLRASEVALVSSPDGGALVRIIAGDVAGHAGPGSTYSPMTMVHATLNPGARLSLPWRPDYNALVYVLAGQGSVGPEGKPIGTGQLAVLGEGNAITVAASTVQESRSPNLDVIILGGRPIREPVAWMGPFVMNTREEVMQAVVDYQAGRLGSIPAVHNTPTTIDRVEVSQDRSANDAERADPRGGSGPAPTRQYREFTDEPPTEAELHALTEVARWSGSSRNSQPWRFIVIRDQGDARGSTMPGCPRHARSDGARRDAIVLSRGPGRRRARFRRGSRGRTVARWRPGCSSSAPASPGSGPGSGRSGRRDPRPAGGSFRPDDRRGRPPVRSCLRNPRPAPASGTDTWSVAEHWPQD